MAARVEINSPSSYKKCSKKSYEVYVCMPPKGTVVINKLEQADIVKALNGKTYFTVDEINSRRKAGGGIELLAIREGKAYVVSDQTPFVIAGARGEMWAISADKLASTYTFLQGGQPVAINQQTLNQRLLKNGLLNWTLIRTSSQATMGQNMACFVPTAQKCQIQTSRGEVLNVNGAGVRHGKGDFIVCAMTPDGKPNLADRWVVNGEIFATTYNNQGWTDCLSSSSVRNITIDSLPKLLPQNTIINGNGIDPNVFKQKCDTLIKELQKVYKFSVKSNTYESVSNYRGIAQEVEFDDDCYVAKYEVNGNFSRTYSVKDKTTGNMTEKTVTANETMIWFCCTTHKDSAISMSISPKTDGLYLSGWAFPHNSNTKSTDNYWSCRVGTINDMNCAEEVKLFKEKCKGRDVFIDNRKNGKSSKDYLDAHSFLACMPYSHINGSIGVNHVLEKVYSNLNSDTLKERVNLCYKEYINLDVGHGSASLAFAEMKELDVKGSMLGQGILSRKMNLKSLIKYLVSACQQEETYYDALTILYRFSKTALTEAILELFYDNDNPNLNILWKRLDLQYMFKSEIRIEIYERSEHDVNKNRVCIDFHLNDFDDGVFVRCFYTAAGNYGFDFIPKTPLHEYNVGATFSFDKDYDNYIELCKQLRDSCYMCLTDFTCSDKTFINNLPKYLIKNDFDYLERLGSKVGRYFDVISYGLLDANNNHNTEYNKETSTYRIKFAVNNNETRTIYMSEDNAHTVSVKCTLNGVNFEKSYKLSIKRNIIINAMLIFSDICKVLKIHPGKALLKSKRLWDRIAQSVSEKFSDERYREFDSNIRSKIDKITPVSIKFNATNYEVLMKLFHNEEVIGTRILVVDFNYENFDIRNSRSRSIKALNDLRHDFNIVEMMFTMHYKYGSTDWKGTKHDTSLDEHDIEMALYWATWDLINTTKKYQIINVDSKEINDPNSPYYCGKVEM